MRIGIGIILINVALILFAILLPENTPWIWVTLPLFVIGFGFIYSKVYEIEGKIAWLKKIEEEIAYLKKELNEFCKKE